jgi:hypothetical protein
MLDMWTDVFASSGKRTTGTREQTFAIVGPEWHGTLPAGVTEIRAPTAAGWLIVRTQINGKVDAPAVHNFQDGITAVPLSSYGKPYVPPKGTVDSRLDMSAPVDQVARMDPETYFKIFTETTKKNPRTPTTIWCRMRRIGMEPGREFDFAGAPLEARPRSKPRRRRPRSASTRRLPAAAATSTAGRCP